MIPYPPMPPWGHLSPLSRTGVRALLRHFKVKSRKLGLREGAWFDAREVFPTSPPPVQLTKGWRTWTGVNTYVLVFAFILRLWLKLWIYKCAKCMCVLGEVCLCGNVLNVFVV